MIRNLLLTALRSLNKNKFFSLLNILGLGLGMAVFLFIAQYVHFERSYEEFIPDARNIYRVNLEAKQNREQIMASAENFPGVGPALDNEFAEVLGYARLYNLGYKNNVIITNEDAEPDPIAAKHRRFLYADSSFLPMMGYTLSSGDSKTALAEPLTAVISEKYARIYFGDEDPIGKTLRMQDDDYANELVKITGVFKELPANTHLKFDVLFSYKTLFGRGDWAVGRYDQSWQRKDMYTFVKLAPGTDVRALEAKFPAVVNQYKPGLAERNQEVILTLQPLKDIHLNAHLAEEFELNGDAQIVRVMAIIGLFVILIAWINYVNLSTAKAMERAREVGVRKVMGAFKSQLMRQFLIEAALVNLIAMVIAVGIVALAWPRFNNIAGLSLDMSYLFQSWFLLLMLALWLAGTLLSGFYPAVVLSSFRPVVVLKGKLRNSGGGILLRKSLVVLQFMASVGLIAGTLIVYKQLNFMMQQDIGMNIDQVLVVERPGISPRDRQAFNSAIDVFRDEIKKDRGIKSVSASATIPGKQREYKANVKPYGAPDDKLISVRFNSMDYDFLDVFQMKLVAGRTFSQEFPADQDTSVIITESAAKLLGYNTADEAVGQTLAVPQFQFNPIIVGVVNDYHQVSFKQALDPTVFYCTLYGGEFYSMRLQTTDLSGTIEHARASWSKAFPGNPFDFFFLDDYFNQQYQNEERFGSLVTAFSLLAVFIGCLGLFGLSAYTATQRTKEIGIRKVLGSSVNGIFMLLSAEYVKLVLLAIVLATPLVWYAATKWIETFPYRTDISGIVFAVAGVSVLVIAVVTVSYQTIRAARVNPVESLRHE